MLGCLVIAAALTAAGCAPTIDASTESTMQDSIAHVRSTLDAADRESFDTALRDLNDMLFNRTDAVSQATIGLYRPEALVRKILHRKNAFDVIRMVDYHRCQHP
ncbi:MAG: hypothetical protein FJ119_14620 [Deltaproteobacteria bacterium]|nr:hypothetical protein [Deltaproteobacteria bacterium]